nr:hypothetical protein [uncultured Massilia sp.]
MKMDSTKHLVPPAPMYRSRRLCDVGDKMAGLLAGLGRRSDKPIGKGDVAGINDTLYDWREALAAAAAVKPWRARIGRAADFPLHAPNDVERAMEAEIAELRAQLVQVGPVAATLEEAGHA